MSPRTFALTVCAVTFAAVAHADPNIANNPEPLTFRWRPALAQSAIFLGVQQTYRFADQQYTRAELRGPFIKDYFRSVRGISGWDDGDDWIANYVGHPMEGAVAGYIQIQNDPRGMNQEFGSSAAYWRSRLRALGFSALYSTQYEIGPFGEAAWGNVGKTPRTKGMVDLVLTPTLGISLLVLEDTIDKHLIQAIERKTSNKFLKIIARSLLNPDRAFANVLRMRHPWHRDTRPGVTALQ